MDKTLQTTAWNCLPREFREEVKKEWSCIDDVDRLPHDAFLRGKYQQMRDLFGIHNLTSDAEGEDDEVLTVSRKDMQFYYQYYKAKSKAEPSAEQKAYYKGRTKVLLDLFGSKCLPDDTNLSEKLTGSEPKFRKDEKVRIKGVAGFDVIKAIYGTGKDGYRYELVNEIAIYDESDLEPYTEPTDFGKEVNFSTKKQSRNLSQNCDKEFDNILKGSFLKERRLDIAAQIAQTLIQGVNFLYTWSDEEIKGVAHNSIRIADTLIAEVEIE